MPFDSTAGKDIKSKKLSPALYASVVRSLYADSQSLFVGVLCLVAAPLIIYIIDRDQYQLLFAAIFLALGMVRIMLSQGFFNSINDDTTVAEYRTWERRYFYSSCSFFACIGAWFLLCLLGSNDPAVYFLAGCVCLSYVMGVLGRNFGSDSLVLSQVLILSGIMIAGLVLKGGVYYWILALFLVPYFASIRMMSTRLRKMLFFSELASEANQKIADRFNVALENVTHGIAMFDANGKIVVANDRFIELAGFDKWSIHGNTLPALVENEREGANLASRLLKFLSLKQSTCFQYLSADKRTIEVDYNSMKDGGVVVLSDISDRVRSEKVIRDLANFDPLTNLPNRRHFVQEATKLIGKNGEMAPCAMFFIDLDKFKEVNDSLGHSIGDRLLAVVARRLDNLFGNKNLLCRFGGDEFVVLMPGVSTREECDHLAEKLIKEVQTPVTIGEHNLIIGTSVGIAIAPENGRSIDELLQNTDSALYEAKRMGRASFAYYSEQLGENLKMRRQLESDLEFAILNQKIDVHFQPLINLKRGRITTCEALVRWDHPQLGRISPEKFVSIAEEAGTIGLLGRYVLRKAMYACLDWPEHVRVAVNVSSVQFKRSNVIEIITTLLEETGLPPSRLEIEVTETVMLENTSEVTAVLHELSRLGVKISLDDFGTGFSSLSYLHSLPFDKVKIDRSFIENGIASDRSLTLLKGVVDLIKRLGLSVVLEGIENEKQMQVLARSVDVNEVQGFLFSRPLPEKDIKALLQASPNNASSTTDKSAA